MPFILDTPTRILVPAQLLQLICLDASRDPPLLYLAHDTPSGRRVFLAELSWSYLVADHMMPMQSALVSATHIAPTTDRMGSVSSSGGAGQGSPFGPRR